MTRVRQRHVHPPVGPFDTADNHAHPTNTNTTTLRMQDVEQDGTAADTQGTNQDPTFATRMQGRFQPPRADQQQQQRRRWSRLPFPLIRRCYSWSILLVLVWIAESLRQLRNRALPPINRTAMESTRPTLLDDDVPALSFPDSLRRNGIKKKNRNNKAETTTTAKTILYWNQYWDFPSFQFGTGHQPFLDAGCPVSNCVAVPNTPERTPEEQATMDAVLIHAADDANVWKLSAETAPWRRPHQRFVYMTMESPGSYYSHSVSLGSSDFLFNWTMTYRRDSDLPRPYGFFQPLSTNAINHPNHNYYSPIQWEEPQQPFIPYDQHQFLHHVLPTKPKDFHRLAERPKKVAWIVSRCDSPSRREEYVAQLAKYIPVDILGACGTIPCNQSFHDTNRDYSLKGHRNSDNCTAAVVRDYKFYLALENSFCRDYVTEKFFRRIHSSLVVVLGGANYSRMAPPHSYVNALDYDTPQALAAYLHELDQNQSLYLSYFWWKDHYQVHSGTATDHASTMCRLCEMLHHKVDNNNNNNNKTANDSRNGTGKIYPSITTWHGIDSQCWKELPKVIQDLPRKDIGNAGYDDDNDKLLDDHV